jgi:hypothetical protein
MYCSACGAAVARDLAYCNHCGAQVIGLRGVERVKPAELFPDSLVWATVSVFVIGVGCMIGLLAVMKNYGMNDGLTMGFVAAIFGLMLAIEAVFIGMLFSRRGGGKSAGQSEAVRGRQQTTNELEGVAQRALREPAASVTEHTTRTFEPVHRGRKAE